jgi:CBS domain containing-hemolysin-like protein
MLIALATLCALLEGIFTSLEVALGATSRARLRQTLDGAHDALRVAQSNESKNTLSAPKPHGKAPSEAATKALIRRIERTLVVLDNSPRTTLLFIVVTSLSLWAATSLLTWQAILDGWPIWVLPVALCGVLFIAEVLPVLIAAPRAEAIALRGSGVVQFTQRLLSPLLFLVGSSGTALGRTLGARENAAPQVTEDELRTALAAAEEEGTIESGERALLEGAMDFRARLVREVMTTRREIVAVEAQTPLAEVLRLSMEEGHSRFPIYEKSLDKIVGIAATKDLIPFLRDGKGKESAQPPVSAIARPPFFVPETKRIAPTLEELRRQRSLMAIVVDDEGATVGLVTLEDLLEEIVGDIQDEYDAEEPPLRVIDDSAIGCEGGVTVREVERFLEKSFNSAVTLRGTDDEEADDTISVAALALQLFDSVPGEGERIAAGVLLPRAGERDDEDEVETLELEIARMDGPRIVEVIVRRVPAAAAL